MESQQEKRKHDETVEYQKRIKFLEDSLHKLSNSIRSLSENSSESRQ